MNAVLINGRAVHQVDSGDRGLQYGDGLFETIACRDGQARWLALHLERLQQGCERLRLAFRDFEALRTEIGGLAAGQRRCIVKVIVTRGTATRRGYAPAGDEQPTRIVSRHDWLDTPAPGPPGFRLGVSGVTLGVNPAAGGLKHLNRLEQVLAQMARDEAALDEVLMVSTAGQVIGGSMSNVFLADDKRPVHARARRLRCRRRDAPPGAAGRSHAGPARVRARGGAVRTGHGARSLCYQRGWGVQSACMLDGRVLPSDAHARQLCKLIDATHA